MKKRNILAALLVAALPVCADAQQQLYICDGFKATPVIVEANAGITFSKGQKHIYINNVEYDIEDIDSITPAAPIFKEVKVAYNGAGATVDIPSYVSGVTSSVSGANVTLTCTNATDEILYTVSGESTNGSLTINSDYKLTLQLAGVSLTSTGTNAAINVNCGKRIGVILKEGTVNTFADASTNTAKGAIYFKGHPEFEGAGTLNVTGKAKHALAAGEYLQLKKSTGTINILASASDGIHCGKGKDCSKLSDDSYLNNYFIMNGGNVTVSNVTSDCIDCDDYGCAQINGGTLTLNVSQEDGKGLKVDSILTMTGGDIKVNLTGQTSDGIRCNYAANFSGGTIDAAVAGNGSKGIKLKKETDTSKTVLNGGNVNFNGTNITMTVSGVKSVDKSKCMGMNIDGNLTQTAGTLSVTLKSPATTTTSTTVKVGGEANYNGGTHDW